MIWIYYTDEKPFANEPEDIAFAVRSDEKTVRLLLRHFFNLEDDGWHQVRCDKEIAEYHGKKEKAKNSANARWKTAYAMRPHSERNANARKNDANQEPRTKNQEPRTNSNSIGDLPVAKAKRATQLPESFFPDETGQALARELRVSQSELEKFRDYHTAKGSTMKDWQAAWRTWVRNAAKFSMQTNGNHKPNSFAEQKQATSNTIRAFAELGNLREQQNDTTLRLGFEDI